MSEHSGQCLCGAVRFRLTADPLTVRLCWCRDCQHLAANGTVNALVRTETLEATGALAEYDRVADSGSRITRQFCPNCGTHLFARVDARPQFRVVRVGNLDHPSAVPPVLNIWTDSAPAWACLDSSLQGVPRQPAPPTSAPTTPPPAARSDS